MSQMQAFPSRSWLARWRRADTLKVAYLKMLNVSHIEYGWRLGVKEASGTSEISNAVNLIVVQSALLSRYPAEMHREKGTYL